MQAFWGNLQESYSLFIVRCSYFAKELAGFLPNHPSQKGEELMRVLVEKAARRLRLLDGAATVLECPVALSGQSVGRKEREGDGKTPEGVYHICLVKEQGKYGRGLGLDYPAIADAKAGFERGAICADTLRAILEAHQENRRPPWGSPLGGEIYLHGGGIQSDWTQGCIALREEDIERLYQAREQIDEVEIRP